jgi:hypothetical protein
MQAKQLPQYRINLFFREYRLFSNNVTFTTGGRKIIHKGMKPDPGSF